MDPLQSQLQAVAPYFAFVVGAAVGSFLNVVIYRIPRSDPGLVEEVGEKMTPHGERLSILYPRRSFCPQCHAPIEGRDNIPLASYFLLAGKCRNCRAAIPFRYFFIEFLTAILFAHTAHHFLSVHHLAPDWGLVAVWSAFAATMVAVTFIDIDFQIIPDVIDIPGMILAPIICAALWQIQCHVPSQPTTFDDLKMLGIHLEAYPWLGGPLSSLIGIVVGAGIIYTIGVLGAIAFRKEAMGFGDVKLLGMLGGFLGWRGVIFCLLLACFVGAFVGIAIKLLTKKHYIPFGPFLAGAALVMVYWRYDLAQWIANVFAPFVASLLGPK